MRAERKIQSAKGIPAMILQLVSECREEGHITFAIRHLATINKESLSREMKVSITNRGISCDS